jgi:hypothetical protein
MSSRGEPWPPGVRFFDAASEREMIYATSGGWAGWLLFRRPDGQWVSLCEATDEDRRRLEAHTMALGALKPFEIPEKPESCG